MTTARSADNQTRREPCDYANELVGRIKERVGKSIRDLQINLITEQGWVMRGKATSYFAKQAAQEVVMQLTALPIIINDIHVS